MTEKNKMERVEEILEELKEEELKDFIIEICNEDEKTRDKLIKKYEKDPLAEAFKLYNDQLESIYKSFSPNGFFNFFTDNKGDLESESEIKDREAHAQIRGERIGEEITFTGQKERENAFDFIQDNLNKLKELQTEIPSQYSEEILNSTLATFNLLLKDSKDNEKASYFDQMMEFNDLFSSWNKLFSVQMLTVDKMLSLGNMEGAVETLKQYEKEADTNIYALGFAEKLLGVYKETRQKQNYISKLVQVATDYNSLTADQYNYIKNMTDPDNWKNLRAIMIKAVNLSADSMELLYDEKEYGKLSEYPLSMLKDNPVIWDFMKNKYADQFLQRYEMEIKDMLPYLDDPMSFDKLNESFNNMLDIKGGLERAEKLRNDLIKLYPDNLPLVKDLVNLDIE